MPLTANQIDTVRALDWLLDDERFRRTGRTLAIAIALIRKALRFPGQQVHYFDHVPSIPRQQQIHISRTMIEGLIRRDALLHSLNWRFSQRYFSLGADLTDGLPSDWWPPEDILEPTLANLLQAQEGDALVARSPGSLQAALEQERQLDERLKQIDQATRRSAWERLVAEDS